jgi:hypothetical protein
MGTAVAFILLSVHVAHNNFYEGSDIQILHRIFLFYFHLDKSVGGETRAINSP